MNPDSNEPDPIETVIELEVPPGQSPVRIDLYLTDKTANATRTKVQRAIKEGRVEVNGALSDRPETVNAGPHDAWMIVIELKDPSQTDGLLDAAAYTELVS